MANCPHCGIDLNHIPVVAQAIDQATRIRELEAELARLTEEGRKLREALEKIAADDPHNPGWRRETARAALAQAEPDDEPTDTDQWEGSNRQAPTSGPGSTEWAPPEPSAEEMLDWLFKHSVITVEGYESFISYRDREAIRAAMAEEKS